MDRSHCGYNHTLHNFLSFFFGGFFPRYLNCRVVLTYRTQFAHNILSKNSRFFSDLYRKGESCFLDKNQKLKVNVLSPVLRRKHLNIYV